MIKTKARGGYSIVEVVIALSFIVVVTITALSIVLSSIVTRKNAIDTSKAQDFADNVWESFKAADTKEEFLSLVAFSEGVSLGEGVPDGSAGTVYTYYSQEHGFTADITVRYPQTARPEIEITVTDKGGDEIISFSYRKGGGI